MAATLLILVALFSVGAIVEAQQSCSVAGYTASAINGRCYKIVSNAQRYTTAEALCERDHAYLASVHNSADNSALLAIGEQLSFNVWLGAVCVSSSTCAWADGTPFDYRNFYSNSPDTTIGKCLYMAVGGAAGQWVSADCSVSEFAAVCELPRQLVPTSAPFLTTTSAPQTPITCPYNYFFTTPNTIYSPGYPSNYGNNLNCVYVVSAPSGYVVSVTFSLFYTETCCDIVRLFDGFQTTRPAIVLSGSSIANYTYTTSTSNILTLTFTTDASVTYQGFVANFVAVHSLPTTPGITGSTLSPATVPPIGPPQCPSFPYYSGNGTIASPHYPNVYDNYLNCTWILQPNLGGYQVELDFGPIATEPGRDIIRVYDGNLLATGGSSSPLIASLSGSYLTGYWRFRSRNNALTVTFITDQSVVYSGFGAFFYTVRQDAPTAAPLSALGSCPTGFAHATGTTCYRLIANGDETSCTTNGWRSPNAADFDLGVIYSLAASSFGTESEHYVRAGRLSTVDTKAKDWLPGEPKANAGECVALKLSKSETGRLVVPCDRPAAVVCETDAV